MSETLDVLAFGPHPDDVELCCGGTLALLVARGWRVGVVDLTRGELGSNGTVEQRAAEAAAASAVLGLAHRENLGLPDGSLRAEDPDQLGAVVDAIRRLRPELVLAPWRRARHPDHEAGSQLVTRACYLAGLKRFATGSAMTVAPFRPRRLWYYPMRVEVRPSLVVDVSAVHEAKMKAIRCYGSQVSRAASDTATAVNDPRTIELVAARDRVWGGHIGVDHGEAFVSQTTLGVADPMQLLRDNPFDGALLFAAD